MKRILAVTLSLLLLVGGIAAALPVAAQDVPGIATVSLPATEYVYNGKVQTPPVTVVNTAGETLTEGVDYTVAYPNVIKDVGTYKAVVTFCGNYTGTRTLTYRITHIPVSTLSITLAKNSAYYDGKVHTPTVTVINANGTKLGKNVYYTVKYASGRKKAGTYKVTVTMKGNYKGSKTLTYKILSVPASKAKISLSSTVKAYTGKKIPPTVTVKNPSGATLKKGTDYTITYNTTQKCVGQQKITIKFKGSCTGSKAVYYKILPTTKSTMWVRTGKTSSIGAKSNRTITYTSSNKAVAKVSSKGVVTGVKPGTATITVKSGTVSRKITVRVAKYLTVAQITGFSAETFNGGSATDDWSRPTNSYLPKGTVDHVVGTFKDGNTTYLKLRCGLRVYVDKKREPYSDRIGVAKSYYGLLPDTNNLSVAAMDMTQRDTTITLNTEWKAPFQVDVLPQTYKNPSTQNYVVTKATGTYVQIRLFYAKTLTGPVDIPADHPLFTKATIVKGDNYYDLRLYLRQAGAFYGWSSAYNEDGQLVLRFLHPAQVTEADNAYGADLTGVQIMLDVGHGGWNVGAVGLSNSSHPESERNMNLARLLKTELESMGAEVTLNRDASTVLDADTRMKKLVDAKPDLCIAIHHDAAGNSTPCGFGSYYYYPHSQAAAKFIYDATMDSGIYSYGNRNKLSWHYYFVGRMSDCPVVLTENGFMTNRTDHNGIMSAATNLKKAQAIAQGTADYFLSLRLPTE